MARRIGSGIAAAQALVVIASSSAIAMTSASCMADAKGGFCYFDDMLVSGDNLYCPDPKAQADCETLNDVVVDAAVRCGAGTFTEEQLRAELDEGGALQECDRVTATSVDFDACLDHFTRDVPDPGSEPANDDEAPLCTGTSLAPLPEVCVGAVLIPPREGE